MIIPITVYGKPIVKKNTMRVTARGSYYTQPFIEWRESALLQIRTRWNKLNLKTIEKCKITFAICPPDRRRFDLSNMIEGMQDALVKEKVIVDDDWKHLVEISAFVCDVFKCAPYIIARIDDDPTQSHQITAPDVRPCALAP